MISVVIPSYNSEQTIRKCLDSILNQSYSGPYEAILVDSSNDSTPVIVSSFYPNVKLIHLGQKTDPGTARNLGVREAKGELIAFIDSDCIAAQDWLENIHFAHESDYSIVGGVVNNGNEDDDLVAWAGYMAEFREFLPEQTRREVMHIPTCNISYKKEVFDEFGVFRGEYYPQEDLMYNYNLWTNGVRLLLNPAIRVWHHHRSELKDFLRHQRKIGAITSKVLKIIPLEGSFIARNPALAPLFIPLLPVVKFGRTVSTFLRLQPQSVVRRPLVLLILALGLVSWARGFAQSIYEK